MTDPNAYPRCTHVLRLAGKAYPRTCAECRLGPCKALHTPAPAQPEPPTAAGVEPVAWLDPEWRRGQSYWKHTSPVTTYEQTAWTPLYTTPPTLTDAQCDAIQEAVWVFEMSGDPVGSDEMHAIIRAAANESKK